jgi:hypothetical protein
MADTPITPAPPALTPAPKLFGGGTVDRGPQPPLPSPPPAKATIASSADAQGYVTVYDHGPRSSSKTNERTAKPDAHGSGGLPAGDATPKETDADAAWYKKNGDGPVAMRMAAVDAAQAIENDPERYSLEPLDVDESAVTAKMDEIRKKRDAVAKATQDVADRAQAVQEVMSDRVNAKAQADAAKPADKPAVPPKFGVQRPSGFTPSPPKPAPATPPLTDAFGEPRDFKPVNPVPPVTPKPFTPAPAPPVVTQPGPVPQPAPTPAPSVDKDQT